MAMESPSASTLLWPSGWYVRTDTGWYQTSRFAKSGASYPDMPLYVGPGAAQQDVPSSDVREIVRVRASAEYHGIRFTLGAIWHTGNEDEFVRHPVPFASPGLTVLLYVDGPAAASIATLVPSARFDAHRDTVVTVEPAVSDIRNYEMTVEPIVGDWGHRDETGR